MNISQAPPKYIIRLFVDGKFVQQIGAFATVELAIEEKKIVEIRDPRVRVRVYEMREVLV